MKKTISIILLSLLMVFILAACGGGNEEEMISIPVNSAIIAEGQLLPVKALDHSFSISGQVSKVLVEEGQSVRVDQILVQLVDSAEAHAILEAAEKEALAAQQALDDYVSRAVVNQAQAQIEAILARKRRTKAIDNANASGSTETRARLDEANGEYELLQALFERIEANGGLDPDEMNTLEARVSSTQANVESAKEAIDAFNLRAAMDGIVTDLRVIEGQRITPDEVMLSVANFDEWIIETDNLTEIEIVEIMVGQVVLVRLDALPDVTLSGEVISINDRFEEKRGDITFTATILLKETDPLMRWGMTAAVEFVE